MPFLWIALPSAWDLQDVQAALNVVVTVLSAFCVFVFARVCWQTATAKVVKNRNVPLAALLSVNTLGEVYDVSRLLGLELLSSYYLRILAQCIVVTGLTVVAFASGPLVRYSTRWGTKLVYRNVPGLMANRLQGGISHENVLWKTTLESLDQAEFPHDRLLDYIPNPQAHWKYVPEQWNSSWSLECEDTELTSIALTVVETKCNENTTLNDQIPALESIYPENARRNDDHWVPNRNGEGFQGSDNNWIDMLTFRTGYEFLRQNNESGIWEEIDIILMALHMKGIPGLLRDTDSYCSYAPGPIDSATYTKVVCKLRKRGKDDTNIAYPDNDSLSFLSMAYNSYFQGRYSREHIAKQPFTVIRPQILKRFYQVYHITQDTQYKHPVPRKMNIELDVVRLSTIFVIVCGAAAALCVFGILRFGVFSLRHWKAVDRTPQSKLDWMIQSIEKSQAGSPLIPHTSPYQHPNTSPYQNQNTAPYRSRNRHSVMSMRSPDLGSPTVGRRRSDFETATYGSSPEPSTPYHMSWLSRQSSAGGGYFPLQEENEGPHESEGSLLERYPTAPAGPLDPRSGSGAFGSDYQIHR